MGAGVGEPMIRTAFLSFYISTRLMIGSAYYGTSNTIGVILDINMGFPGDLESVQNPQEFFVFPLYWR